MIFSEIYSVYYNAVARILRHIKENENKCNLTEADIDDIINEEAFKESKDYIKKKIASGAWSIINKDFTTGLQHSPTMPLTTIQKRWLKAISLDPRIKLFDFSFEGLDDVEPLFTPEDYKVYDQYSDGDNFEDENYIKNFRLLLDAIEKEQALKITFLSGANQKKVYKVLPDCLDYSEKDDKFRLLARGIRDGATINLGRIISIEKIEVETEICLDDPMDCKQKSVIIKIIDKDDSLERCLIHFAHFKKECKRIDDKNFLLEVTYDKNDELEVCIRILSFGAKVEVVEPQAFRELIIEKLKKQKSYEI